MKRWAAIFIVLLVAVGIAAYLVAGRTQNRLVVANSSGQAIRTLTITVGGETIRFDNLAAGASRSAPFPIRNDDHFAVRGKLADGAEIHVDCGYVTGGMHGEQARFTIQPGGRVDFRQGQYETYKSPGATVATGGQAP